MPNINGALATIEFSTWTSEYIAMFHVDLINHPCHAPILMLVSQISVNKTIVQ